jgi:hypothetical protein
MNVASLELCKELFELSGVVAVPVKGLEDKFIVTEQGKIFSLPSRTGKGKERKLYTNKEGYQYINYLDADGMRHNLAIHRAVATAFIPNPENKPQVNHKDSNPSNNHVNNLEWSTSKENTEHSKTMGKADKYQNRGEKHGMHKLTEADVRYIRQPSNESNWHLSKRFGVSVKTIEDAKSRRRWKHVA